MQAYKISSMNMVGSLFFFSELAKYFVHSECPSILGRDISIWLVLTSSHIKKDTDKTS